MDIDHFSAILDKIMDVKDPCIKIIHRWLNKLICGRGQSDLILNEVELNCMYEEQYNLAILIAFNLESNMKRKRKKLFGGLYVTNLAWSLVDNLISETVYQMEELGMATW